MRKINVEDSVIADLFSSDVWSKAGYTLKQATAKVPDASEKLTESEEAKEEVLVEDTEKHVCPLCESVLEENLSDDKLQEHVNYILGILNENFETEESLEGDAPVEEEAKDEQ